MAATMAIIRCPYGKASPAGASARLIHYRVFMTSMGIHYITGY